MNTTIDNTERLEKIFEAYDKEYRKQKLANDFRMLPVAFNISNLENDTIERLAKRYKVNKSEFIRICINYFTSQTQYKNR